MGGGGGRAPASEYDSGGELRQDGLDVPLAHAAQLGDAGQLRGTGTGLARFPVVDGGGGDLEEPAQLGGGEAQALPLGAQALGAEAQTLGGRVLCDGVGRSRYAGRASGPIQVADLLVQLIDGALEGGDLTAMAGNGFTQGIEFRLELLAGKAGDLFFEGGEQVGHGRIRARGGEERRIIPTPLVTPFDS